ncbi:MAG: transposase [Candidatus Marinimicrobia bacterium]|nr:transposase [Candidatus Neomarinimicrobiota bacterium]
MILKKDNENIGFWKKVFQDLISRELSKIFVFLMDNFYGLEKLLRKFFSL